MLKLVSILRAANRRLGDARYYDRLTVLKNVSATYVVPYAGAIHDHPMARDERFSKLDMRFVPVRMPRLAGWGDGLHTVSGLREILGEIEPDVIHVNEEPASLLALQAARLRAQVAPDAALVLESDQSGVQPPPTALRIAERAALSKADALVVRHRAALDARRARGFSGQGSIVEHAVDLGMFHPGMRDAARTQLGADGLTLGYVGQLSAEGGLIEVIEAIASSRAPVRLLVMGRGELRNELSDRAMVLKIQDRVRFFEPKAVGDVAYFLNALDALLATTRPTPGLRNPFDRTVAEAQACGVPVIASDEGALPDLVGDGGWTVDAGDAGMLAQLLGRLAHNPSMIAQAGARALDQARSRFDMRLCADKLERVFVAARDGLGSKALLPEVIQSGSRALPQRVEP